MMNTDPREDIVVNHVHPGFIDTDMAANLDEAIRQQGPKPIDRLNFISFNKVSTLPRIGSSIFLSIMNL